MPAVGNRNAGGAATIAEPSASLGDWRPARNLLADPDLHVVDQKRQPTGIASLLKRGGNRQPMDRLHRQLLRRQVAQRRRGRERTLSRLRRQMAGAFACPASLMRLYTCHGPLRIKKQLRDRRFGQWTLARLWSGR